VGLFSKKPKSIIVQKPADKADPEMDQMDRLEELLPKVELPKIEDLPHLADPPNLEAPSAPYTPPPPAPTPTLPKPVAAARPVKPPKPAKMKTRKGGVDPADFLALRSELRDMRARLDESEQAREMFESRLSSLDAAAAAFSTERNDITEVADMVVQLQQQIADAGGVAAASGDSGIGYNHDELSAKVDALHNRMFGLQDHAPKLAEFEAQIAQLRIELDSANAAVAEAAAMPPPPPSISGPDPETLERIAAVQARVNDLDQVRHRLGEIDHLKQRMNELDHLHQRVAGVETLHDRMGELDNLEQRLASVDGLAAQLQQLNARVAAQAELQEVAERLRANDSEARAVRDHMALLDQRLTNVSTELANQLSELGRDIDGLGQRLPEVAEGSVSEEVVDALRGGQVKLANEQARYEIAFRQDLASLAELLRQGHDNDD
jgi:DNA repair exonuclease SbcCD ATPase subunit